MNIDELTLGQLKQIQNMKSGDNSNPYKIGQNYFIRTVTMIYTGKLEAVYKDELVISSAAWIADTGRWYDACTKGKLSEIEPYNQEHQIIIGRGSILDVSPWDFDLPIEQK